jgi:SAM-dependent methyltransferase
MERRRLSFGAVADRYDEARPSYPPALVDEAIAFAGVEPPDRLLEVGAGTGKATVLFAAKGFDVLGIEPSAEMARLARRNCAAYPGVRIEETDFESWSEEPAAFGLLFSAQAWHWVAPEAGYEKARSALRTGGALATFWTFPAWEECALREELAAAYDRSGVVVSADDALGPRGEIRASVTDRDARLAAAAGFADPERRTYRWNLAYTTARYIRLMGTHSTYAVLDEEAQGTLFAAVAAVIDRHGGALTLPMRTRLYLMRADA